MNPIPHPSRSAAVSIASGLSGGVISVGLRHSFEEMTAVNTISAIIAETYRPILESTLKALNDLAAKDDARGGILIPCPIRNAARDAQRELTAILARTAPTP